MRFRLVLAAIVYTSMGAACLAQQPDAPTAGTDPSILDRQWKVGNSQYDVQRKTILQDVERVSHGGPFRPDYESLSQYKVPEWYKDAQFGIFIHWGAYSVPAFGSEWYPRNMYVPWPPEYKHHVPTYATQD